MAEMLAAFSLATVLCAGKLMGHAVRNCLIGMQMASELDLPMEEQAELYSFVTRPGSNYPGGRVSSHW